jgi:hypothetical protein
MADDKDKKEKSEKKEKEEKSLTLPKPSEQRLVNFSIPSTKEKAENKKDEDG